MEVCTAFARRSSGDRGQLVGERAREPFDDGVVQVLFRAEVIGDGAEVGVGAGGDGADAGGVVAVACEQRAGGFDEAVARVAAFSIALIHTFVLCDTNV
jgi:hypothetical protein